MELPLDAVPAADPTAEPQGFIVTADSGDRIHFLDWDGPSARDSDASMPGVLLIHGLSTTAWAWTSVARRLRSARHVVAMDLRGHGLSDTPTEDGAYDLPVLAGDAVAVAEGSGLLTGPDDRIVVAGHGFGAIVAAETAIALGRRCAGIVLVDGGWEVLETSTGLEVEGFLRGLDEPPEVLRSMTAFLADRAAFDPSTWDADQQVAARATVVETHAGRVVPVTRPHVLQASVRAMFAYDPMAIVPRIDAPVVILVAAGSADDAPGARDQALDTVAAAREATGRAPLTIVSFRHDGHNLMRYRPDAVSAAILGAVAEVATSPGS
jgi:pimeloyl-ACP methyl ester carboxylesterase